MIEVAPILYHYEMNYSWCKSEDIDEDEEGVVAMW